jgi:hypothetical protein
VRPKQKKLTHTYEPYQYPPVSSSEQNFVCFPSRWNRRR